MEPGERVVRANITRSGNRLDPKSLRYDNGPKNRKKIDRNLITDLPVLSRKEAIEKLEWYASRWKIEVF